MKGPIGAQAQADTGQVSQSSAGTGTAACGKKDAIATQAEQTNLRRLRITVDN
jgi:hypothetical protein